MRTGGKTCEAPLTFSELVTYWARDDELTNLAEVERIDEHVMGCPSCSAASEMVAKLALGVRDFVPTAVTRAHVGRLRSRGAQISEDVFLPSERKTAVFHAYNDLLIHRLTGIDLSKTDRVDVTVRIESTGVVIHSEDNVPFDTHEGVLIACQRHFAAFPPDTVFEVRATESSGKVQEARYAILHHVELVG